MRPAFSYFYYMAFINNKLHYSAVTLFAQLIQVYMQGFTISYVALFLNHP